VFEYFSGLLKYPNQKDLLIDKNNYDNGNNFMYFKDKCMEVIQSINQIQGFDATQERIIDKSKIFHINAKEVANIIMKEKSQDLQKCIQIIGESSTE